MNRPDIRLGDVFEITLSDDCVAFGQVVGEYKPEGFFVVMFEECFAPDSLPDLSELVRGAPDLIALSLGTRFAEDEWRIVGNQTVSDAVRLPAFKETIAPGRYEIVDYSGRRRRAAREAEQEWVPNRVVFSSSALERAIRARHGIGAWIAEFDVLIPRYDATTDLLFPAE